MAIYKDTHEIIARIYEEWEKTEKDRPEYAEGLGKAIGIINIHPLSDVAPVVQGWWKYEGPINTYIRTKCTICGWWTLDPFISEVYHYCPNCGAKMDLT